VLWIDTDMGFDDMLAVLMVRHAGRDIAGVSLVFGNAPLGQVRRNAADAAALFGWTFPIHDGAARPILGEAVTAGSVLGPTGIPTRGRQLPPGPDLPASPALAALAGWLEADAGPAEILALGPLTNIAILSLARPDLAERIGRITWMGGGATRGNHTASAEFNAFADPEALAIVLQSGRPFRMIDLDVCRQVLVGPEDVERLPADSERAALLADLLGGYVDIALSRGRPAMALYDPVAAAAVVDEASIAFAPALIEVELSGRLTRGRTVVDQRAGVTPNAEIGLSADADRIRRLAFDALAGAAA
jgi:inosine-uridine nucleoside N-ribohydrolase